MVTSIVAGPAVVHCISHKLPPLFCIVPAVAGEIDQLYIAPGITGTAPY